MCILHIGIRTTGATMNTNNRAIYGEQDESSMETHANDDSSITTEERDGSSDESSSEEEIDPWATPINDAASQVRTQTMTSYKRFSWRAMTKVKLCKKPLKEFYLHGRRNWAMSTWITWHG